MVRPVRDAEALLDLSELEQRLQTRRDQAAAGGDWGDHEAIGRLLRVLGRPTEARRHLVASLDRPAPGRRARRWLARGAVHRLLGDDAEANACWCEAASRLEGEVPNPSKLGPLVEARFLAGDDDGALAAAARVAGGHEGRAEIVARLAEARRAGEREAANVAVHDLAGLVRSEKADPDVTAAIGLFDWYEIAQEVADDL